MKNSVKIAAVALTGLLLGTAAFAGKPESSKNNVERNMIKELNSKFTDEYASLTDKPEDNVMVLFKVEKDAMLKLVGVQTDNVTLKSLVETAFSENTIKASADLEGKFYALPVTFKKVDF